MSEQQIVATWTGPVAEETTIAGVVLANIFEVFRSFPNPLFNPADTAGSPALRLTLHNYVLAAEARRWGPYVLSRFAALQEEAAAGALAGITTEALERARRMAEDLLPTNSPTPSVIPSGEGNGLCLVWHKGDWDIEVDLVEGDDSVWARNGVSGETVYDELSAGRGQLVQILQAISEE